MKDYYIYWSSTILTLRLESPLLLPTLGFVVRNSVDSILFRVETGRRKNGALLTEIEQHLCRILDYQAASRHSVKIANSRTWAAVTIKRLNSRLSRSRSRKLFYRQVLLIATYVGSQELFCDNSALVPFASQLSRHSD